MIRTDRMRPKDYVFRTDMPVAEGRCISAGGLYFEAGSEKAKLAGREAGKTRRNQRIHRGPRWCWTAACEAEYELMRRESAA